MESNVKGVHKNSRYKIIKIDKDHYLIDMEPSLWLILFPFAYWFMPHKAYRIDEQIIDEIQFSKSSQGNNFIAVLLAGGLGLFAVQFIFF